MGLRERVLASGVDPLRPKNKKDLPEVMTGTALLEKLVSDVTEDMTAPIMQTSKQRWRDANREHYNAKQREYQAVYRARKKKSGG